MSAVLGFAFRTDSEKTFLLSADVNVIWPQDITCMVAILAITGSVYFLQSHIVEYAFSLIDRQKLLTTLFYQNVELKRQIKEMKQKEENTLDLDSPITKVIKVIRDIQAKCELADDMQASLDKVVDLLSKNQLFLPNLNPGGKMDADVSKWLNSMITNQSNQNEEEHDSGFTGLKQQE
jgi:hypothetical protein